MTDRTRGLAGRHTWPQEGHVRGTQGVPKVDHALYKKTQKPNKLKTVEITKSIYSDQSETELEISNQR